MGWIPRNKWWIYGDFMVMIMVIYVGKNGDFDGMDTTINGDLMVIYPAWQTYKNPLKMAIEIVGFPMNSMVIFQFVMWTFTRGYQHPIGCSWWICENMNSRLVGDFHGNFTKPFHGDGWWFSKGFGSEHGGLDRFWLTLTHGYGSMPTSIL